MAVGDELQKAIVQSARLSQTQPPAPHRIREAFSRQFMSKEVQCSECGKTHSLESSELVFDLPDEIFSLTEDVRVQRCDLSAEFCALDRERFFLRGLLPFPVKGRSDPYRIGIWAEITLSDYKRIYDLWSDPEQSSEPRISAALANKLPLHKDNSLGLAISIQLTGPKTRPEYFIEVMEHELYAEQQLGIDEHRALEYSDRALHSSRGG